MSKGVSISSNILLNAPLYGLDTETVGCNPKKQSPVENAQPVCLTLSWLSSYGFRGSYTSRAELESGPIVDLLEDPNVLKVGSNILSYDKHVLANIGIDLQGVVGDTQDMSRHLYANKFLPDGKGHGLKDWGERLGWVTKDYKEIASRPKRGKSKVYKSSRVVNKNGIRHLYHSGAETTEFSCKTRELIPMEELERDYPERWRQFRLYAVQDAAMSLDVYMHLKERLERAR